MADQGARMGDPRSYGRASSGSIETRMSWVIACVALGMLGLSYGAPLVTVVALKPIAAEFDTARAAPALAVSLTLISVRGWAAS